MDQEAQLQRLAHMVLYMEVSGIPAQVEDCLRAGIEPARILGDGLSLGMRWVGEKFRCGDIYMPEVLVSCDAYYRGLEVVRPHMKVDQAAVRGKMILGTIHGDIHTVGKDVAPSNSRHARRKPPFVAAASRGADRRGWECVLIPRINTQIQVFVQVQTPCHAEFPNDIAVNKDFT